MTRCGYCGALYVGEHCVHGASRVTVIPVTNKRDVTEKAAVQHLLDTDTRGTDAPARRGRPRKANALSPAERKRRQ